MRHSSSAWLTFVAFAALLLLQGCATPSRLSAVPVKETTRAEIPGVPNARYWVDADIEPFIRDAFAAGQREQAYLTRTGHQGALPPAVFLAVSGGGDDGAFGAGLLVGWTQAGTRPEFKGVTGVSTGALIAPFAFLGPDYDDELRAVYTTSGAMAQVFLYPPRLFDVMHNQGRKVAERERKVYIIRNARLDPQWASVERSTLGIAGRAISSLLQTQGVGDLYRIYLTAQEDGLDYNLAYIGADFTAEHKEDFDTAYMRALFDYGYQLGRQGYPWHKTPPGLTVAKRQ